MVVASQAYRQKARARKKVPTHDARASRKTKTSISSRLSVSNTWRCSQYDYVLIGGQQVEQTDEGKFVVVKFDHNKKSEAEAEKEEMP